MNKEKIFNKTFLQMKKHIEEFKRTEDLDYQFFLKDEILFLQGVLQGLLLLCTEEEIEKYYESHPDYQILDFNFFKEKHFRSPKERLKLLKNNFKEYLKTLYILTEKLKKFPDSNDVRKEIAYVRGQLNCLLSVSLCDEFEEVVSLEDEKCLIDILTCISKVEG